MRLFVVLIFLSSVIVAFRLEANEQGGSSAKRSWYYEQMEQWSSLLSKAGQPKSGLILETRLVNKAGEPPRLLLSARNVGVQPVYIIEGFWPAKQPPLVLIHDASGKPVPLTVRGEEYHAPERYRMWRGGAMGETVWPGDAREGELVPLADNFVLTTAGSYAVLTMNWVVGIEGALIAKPIVVTVPSPSDLGMPREPHNGLANDGLAPTTVKGDDTPAEWSRLEAKAGLVQQGYVLEADTSPATPGEMHLVVSLINIDPDEQFIPFNASDARAYRILVRGPNGKFAALNERDRAESATDMRCVHPGFKVGAGNGNGVVIPLGRWFNLTSPGEYTVMVSLPTSVGREEELWVAKPVKLVVGTEKRGSELT